MNNLEIASTSDLFEIARSLPPGHYDIQKSRKLIDKEYKLSRETERKLAKQFPKINHYQVTCPTAQKMCNRICDKLLVRRVKVEVKYIACLSICAQYFCGIITLAFEPTTLCTLIHELTHHVCVKEHMGQGHNQEFCNTMELIWLAFNETYRF